MHVHYIEQYRTEPVFRSYQKACVSLSLFAGRVGGRGGWSLINYSPGPKKERKASFVQGTNLEYHLKDFSAVKVGFQFEV